MARVLITGCGGFIGSHLAGFLLDKGHEVWGTYFSSDARLARLPGLHAVKCDIRNREEVVSVVEQSSPDIVFHLAAQSFVVPSWKDMENTLKTNVLGTAYLLESLSVSVPECTVLVACSSAEYGSISQDETPVSEDGEFRPSSPYAVSKICQDMLSYLFWKAAGMKVVRMRFFNISGPGKTHDACSDFSKGIAEIEAGLSSSLKVGNLEGMRDITDVRDAVRAIELLSRKGVPGDVYNICTGNAHRIGDLLEKLVSLSSSKVGVVRSPDPGRKIDDMLFVGDSAKINALGWQPSVPIETTLSDMLEYWRSELKNR